MAATSSYRVAHALPGASCLTGHPPPPAVDAHRLVIASRRKKFANSSFFHTPVAAMSSHLQSLAATPVLAGDSTTPPPAPGRSIVSRRSPQKNAPPIIALRLAGVAPWLQHRWRLWRTHNPHFSLVPAKIDISSILCHWLQLCHALDADSPSLVATLARSGCNSVPGCNSL